MISQANAAALHIAKRIFLISKSKPWRTYAVNENKRNISKYKTQKTFEKLDGSIGLSPLYLRMTFARQCRYEPLSEFPLTLPLAGIVHHLSGPNTHLFYISFF